MMSRLRLLLAAFLILATAAGLFLFHLTRRALPQLRGELPAPGLSQPVEVVRDSWGVPHIFAQEEEDAWYALGYVHGQDRLFQLDLNRHASQGRLAEMFGEQAVEVDRLFRTVDFHGPARRMLAEARPEVRRGAEAYMRGLSAAVAALNGRLPPEFVLLGHDFEPVEVDDFVGLVGYLGWKLNISWDFDPLYERLVAAVGPERAAELFPYNDGGTPSVHPASADPDPPRVSQARPLPDPADLGGLSLLRLPPRALALLERLPRFDASNNWVVAPHRSASGHAILANDPHLSHGLPPIWYEAHLQAPGLDVTGVTLPGLPFVVIGHNRHIAWGFTNVMQDAADFFLERLDPERPGEVLYKGEWVKLETRRETLNVKGGEPVSFEVHSTPHGPIVTELLPGQEQAVAYRWTLHAADHANEVDGFWLLNRARNWEEFRTALSRFGVVAQNVAYADAQGHIGMQTTGAFPRLAGQPDGTRFRRGWDGSEEWEGFVPFEENPSTFDPERGWLASANNPTTPAPGPFYISSQWEPVDRITRIQEFLSSREKVSVADMRRLQGDTLLVAARELAPLVLEAFSGGASPQDARVAQALTQLRGWDGDMRADLVAPSLFATFYRRLFYEMFEDELGPDLARGYRSKANLSAVMMRAVLTRGPERWWDDVATPEPEDRNAVLRSAFSHAVAELEGLLGGDVDSWTWGRLHTLSFVHPIGGASRWLGPYFNRGPFPVPGGASTVNKMEYREADFRVVHGPSMRQITDFADLDAALGVLPGGQSGIPASPHYDDLMQLWLAGEYHPLPLDRDAVEAAEVLVLTPVDSGTPRR